MPSLAPKSDFLNLDRVVHLFAGGQTPPLASHGAALQRFLDAKGTGIKGQAYHQEARASAARRAAHLIGCRPDDIGFPPSVAHGVQLVADSLDWRPGDNVVLEAWEFPSLLYPWYALRERGVEIRLLAPENWQAPLDRWGAAVDARTRVVAISQVSYLTGERKDVAAFSALAHRVGALLVVDASHALGAVPVVAPLSDFTFSCCYKWVLGIKGVAVGYWNRQRLPDWRPRGAGWHSVEPRPPLERAEYRALGTGLALEPGNPAFASLFVLDNALEYLLRFGDVAIERHVLALSAEVRRRVAALGLPVMTPAAPERRAGNICFAAEDAPRLRAALETAGVLVSGEDGRIRISTHLYNDEQDVERGLAALERVLTQRG